MRARAERLGGELLVSSAPGQGTLIDVVLPEHAPVPSSPPDLAGA
jgi:signal transduction histidine kinase